MKRLSSIALTGFAIVLVTATLGYAAMPNAAAHNGARTAGHPAVGHFAGHPSGGHFAGHPPVGHFDGRRAFDGRRFDGHHVDRRFFAHHFDRRFHGGAVIVAPFFWPYPFVADPGYTYEAPAPTYWYCPSYGAYYPSVQSCPEAWVPVPG